MEILHINSVNFYFILVILIIVIKRSLCHSQHHAQKHQDLKLYSKSLALDLMQWKKNALIVFTKVLTDVPLLHYILLCVFVVYIYSLGRDSTKSSKKLSEIWQYQSLW